MLHIHLKQSTIGDRYTLSSLIENSVKSVNNFSLGLSALKFQFNRFGTAGLISPRYELYFFFLILMTYKF